MKSFLASIMFLFVLSTNLESALADNESNPGPAFSTVKLYFINQWLPDPDLEVPGGQPSSVGLGGGMGGGMMSAPMRFKTVRLFLDDEFIGNAMFRHADVMPTLNLEPGEHRFRIECDGYEKFEETLSVLRYGSSQWLVVKLEPAERPKGHPAAPTTKK